MLTDQTTKVLEALVAALAEGIERLPVQYAPLAAELIRQHGVGLLAEAADRIGIRQIVLVEVEAGAQSGGMFDLSDGKVG